MNENAKKNELLTALKGLSRKLDDLYDTSALADASPENGILYELIPVVASLTDIVAALAALEEGK